MIHNFADIKSRFYLTKCISHDGISNEWTPLTGKPSNNLTGVARFLGSWEFFSPVVINCFIGNVLELRLHKFWVSETLRNINESSAGRVGHQEKGGISKHVLTTRAEEPLVLRIKERLQHGNTLLDNEVFLIFRGKFKHIHTNRMLNIGRIKVNNIINSLLWHTLEQGLYSITVRIDKGKPTAITHVLEGKILKKDRFTHTGLPNYIHVAATIFIAKINSFFVASKLVSTEE